MINSDTISLFGVKSSFFQSQTMESRGIEIDHTFSPLLYNHNNMLFSSSFFANYTPTWILDKPFISTSAVLLAGIVFIPNFATGLGVGTANLTLQLLISYAEWTMYPELFPSSQTAYHAQMQANRFYAMTTGPVIEECIFRGILQPLILEVVTWLVPSASTAILFFGFSLSVAALFSLFVTSILFGAIHLVNQHKAAGLQAVNATIAGIVFGVLSLQFGLEVSIAAHITNNYLANGLLALRQSEPENPDTPIERDYCY